MSMFSPPSADPGPQFVFDVGKVHVAIWPSDKGRFAHFLLFRPGPEAGGRVLFQSGSEHDTAACVAKATRAAHRAGLPG